MMASTYESISLYIPLVQPSRIPSSILIDSSSYWHISALYSILYDSITLPTRTREEHPFSMDMYDFTNHINIHGQRKIANGETAILFNKPGIHDLLPLGWRDLPGEKGMMATVFRGNFDKIDDLTKLLSRGNIITER
jgi:hypothetical protein